MSNILSRVFVKVADVLYRKKIERETVVVTPKAAPSVPAAVQLKSNPSTNLSSKKEKKCC